MTPSTYKNIFNNVLYTSRKPPIRLIDKLLKTRLCDELWHDGLINITDRVVDVSLFIDITLRKYLLFTINHTRESYRVFITEVPLQVKSSVLKSLQ